MSRPVSYTEEFARYILEQMREGRTLVDICDHQTADAPLGLPRSGSAREWTNDEKYKLDGVAFRVQYDRARENCADALFEQVQTIADNPREGLRTEVRTEGEVLENLLIDDAHIGKIVLVKHEDGSAGALTITGDMVGMTIVVQVSPPTVVNKVQKSDNTERSKLQMQARQYLASRIRPAVYGERLAHQMLDENGNPAKAGITVIVDGAPGTI